MSCLEASGTVCPGPWYDNGRLRYETRWREGTKHGSFTFWYPSGLKRAEGEDRDGIPVGTWTSWTEAGVVEQQRTFSGSATEMTGGMVEVVRGHSD